MVSEDAPNFNDWRTNLFGSIGHFNYVCNKTMQESGATWHAVRKQKVRHPRLRITHGLQKLMLYITGCPKMTTMHIWRQYIFNSQLVNLS